MGCEVYLIDLLEHHVKQALEEDDAHEHHVARFIVADARELPLDDASVDVVLMRGPLYHLSSYDDRITALRHARRVLRPGGLLVAAAISRLASLLDGKIIGEVDDPAFDGIVARDLATGHHTNPTCNPEFFTDSYFHDPANPKNELEAAGCMHTLTAAVEGPAFLRESIETRLENPKRRAMMLDSIRRIESGPTALSVTAHLLTVGRRD